MAMKRRQSNIKHGLPESLTTSFFDNNNNSSFRTKRNSVLNVLDNKNSAMYKIIQQK